MNKLSSTFEISDWQEHTWAEGEEDAKECAAMVKQIYKGDISGTSEVRYLMSYMSKSEASFIGHEKLDVEIDGKAGSFVVEHHGKFENGVATSKSVVVNRSGTGDFKGVSGTGKFLSEKSGVAECFLDLEFAG